MEHNKHIWYSLFANRRCYVCESANKRLIRIDDLGADWHSEPWGCYYCGADLHQPTDQRLIPYNGGSTES